MLTRRDLLKHAAVLTGMTLSARDASASVKKKRSMRIGACDWSIGKSSDIGAFALAQKFLHLLLRPGGLLGRGGGQIDALHARGLGRFAEQAAVLKRAIGGLAPGAPGSNLSFIPTGAKSLDFARDDGKIAGLQCR